MSCILVVRCDKKNQKIEKTKKKLTKKTKTRKEN